MIIKSLEDIEAIARFESKPLFYEHYVIDNIEFKEFLLDGTLNIVARKWDPKLSPRMKQFTHLIGGDGITPFDINKWLMDSNIK